MVKPKLGAPFLSPLMHNRMTAAFLVGIAALQSGLVALGLPAWSCPMLNVLGIPCPGCGLTRATLLMLHGDWHTALTLHAFAPLLLLGIIVVGSAALLPEGPRRRLIDRVEVLEQRTGLATILFIALVVYWAFRLVVAPEHFISLVKS
jgi:hypothetical protein